MNKLLCCGNIFTLKDLLALTLTDTPCLNISHENETYPIQTSHISEEELLSIEGWGKSTWVYKFTTSEWIPIFEATPDFNKDLVHIESREVQYLGESDIIVEPKGATERFF